jgi:tetratricopeptide (TPR) repeat protein
MRGHRPRLLCNVLLALAVPLTASAAAPTPPVAETPVDSVFVRADRHLRKGAADSVLALAMPVLERATAAGDRNLELRARILEAGGLALLGRLKDSEQAARRAGELATLLAAPGPGRTAHRWLGYSLLGQGRAAEAAAVYTELRRDALAAGDRREEAYALLGLSYQALGRGEAAVARDGYERAGTLFESAGENSVALDADIGRARALGAEGRYREMCRLYEKVIRVGGQLGQTRVVGYALNNLGSYEYQSGDPGRAVEYWERTLEARRKGGNPAALVTPSANLAMARMALGAFDEARVSLLDLLAVCRAGNYREQEALVLGQLAAVEQSHRRNADARALWRQVLAMGAGAGRDGLEAAIEIPGSLLLSARPLEALQFADSLAAALPTGADAYQMARLDQLRAEASAALGDQRTAVKLAGRARSAFRTGGFHTNELSALLVLSQARRALAVAEPALADSALTDLQEACRLWDDVRAVPRDPQWRERRGALGTAIHLALAEVLLEHPASAPVSDRTRRAFEAMQGYKARTLLERRLGPDAFAAGAAAAEPPVTLEYLQRSVLEPGEVLLDYYLGARASLVFVVTDSSCRVLDLAAASHWRGPVALFLDLLTSSAPGASPVDGAPAARRLSRELIEPCAAELAGARRVVVSADGLLNRLPFELLPAPGPEGEALGIAREVMRVPSATVLASIRRHAGSGVPRGLVVVAGGEARGDVRLPGAEREAAWLDRRFRDVQRLEAGGAGAENGRWLQAASGAAVLHIPAHSEVYDQRPWNSRIRAGADPDGNARWLVSADIAANPLAVPLVVLSSCSSAGGQALSGEGMLGLTGAFLAAGPHAVVASLWDVDDAVAAQFMKHFYRELEKGATVAGALAATRRALAAQPATAAPIHWAGFVVVGDGSQVVALERRPSPARPAAFGGVAALGVLGSLWLTRRSHPRNRRVISGRERTLP